MSQNNNTGSSAMDFASRDKREALRHDQELSARIKDNPCVVLNISKKGVLLETGMPLHWFPVSAPIQFELELDGEWMPLDGTVKWVATDQEHSRLGVFIKRAPAPYMDYLKDQYA